MLVPLLLALLSGLVGVSLADGTVTKCKVTPVDGVLRLECPQGFNFSSKANGKAQLMMFSQYLALKQQIDSQDLRISAVRGLLNKLVSALSPTLSADNLYDLSVVTANKDGIKSLNKTASTLLGQATQTLTQEEDRFQVLENRLLGLENHNTTNFADVATRSVTLGKLVKASSSATPSSPDQIYDVSVLPGQTTSLSQLSTTISQTTTNLNKVIDLLSPAATPTISTMYNIDTMYTNLQNSISTANARVSILQKINNVIWKYDDMYNMTGNLVLQSDFVDPVSWQTPPSNLLPMPWLDGSYITTQVLQETSGTGCYPGWSYTNIFPIDPRKNYKFSIWLFSEDIYMSNYLGFFVFDEKKTRINDLWSNPYFHGTRSDAPAWTYHSGFLLAANSPSPDNFTATYTFTTGTTDTDWIMPPNARYAQLRFGSCYADGYNYQKSYFAFPSVTEVQPSPYEASIFEMQETLVNDGANLLEHADYIGTEGSWSQPALDLVSVPWIDGRPVTVQQSVEDITTSCYSGWTRSNVFPVDIRSGYEFGVWIKSDDPGMANYVGFNLFDFKNNALRGSYDNPYFKASRSDQNSWKYVYGWLLPYDTPDSYNGIVSIAGTPYTDWVFENRTNFALMRMGSCYSDGKNFNRTYYAFPYVRKLIPGRVEELFNQYNTLNKMLYIGRWNVPVAFDGTVSNGVWAAVNQASAVGIDFSDYNQYVRATSGQKLMMRVCTSYTDTGTTGLVRFRLRRQDGASAGYAGGYVFWTENFAASYSSAGLIHHECGTWLDASSVYCGYSWTDTCQFDVSHSQTSIYVTVKDLAIELAVKTTVN